MNRVPLWWFKFWHLAVAVQWLLAGIVALIPFGFDHRSSWGLDFGHYLIALAVVAFLSLVAFASAVCEKSIAGTILSLIPVAAFLYFHI